MQKQVKVQAVLTAGRYENTWCRNIIENALTGSGIPLVVSGGVYYGQCMQMMLEDAMEAGVEYAITVDGDSVFTREQVLHLLSVAVQEDYECLASMQVRRGKPHMLGHKLGERSAKWNGQPIEVDTAHFGLTVIDLAKLKTVAKPWFFCQPDANGGWRGDKIDSDIWFWKQWKAAGLKCRIDPHVRIGHLEEMVVSYGDDYQVHHYYPAEWQVNNGLRKASDDVERAPAREGAGVASGCCGSTCC
jgi:hypothetical protein